jgi:hypothetical protein
MKDYAIYIFNKGNSLFRNKDILLINLVPGIPFFESKPLPLKRSLHGPVSYIKTNQKCITCFWKLFNMSIRCIIELRMCSRDGHLKAYQYSIKIRITG